MPTSLVLVVLCALVASFVWFASKYFLASRRPKNFPPGPPTAPFIGNIHQLPIAKGFLKFHELGKEYGSIIGLKLGPQNIVVLNSYKHVKALFDKKGAIYSSRPANHIGNDIVCPNETHILLLPYGNAWRKQRKVVQALLNVNAVDTLLPIQNAEATQTLFQLLEDPEGFYDHIRRYSTAVILASVFGQRGATFDSPKVQALYRAQDQFTAILEQGATPPVDVFPFLKMLPNFVSPWRSWARSIRKEQRELYFTLLRETRDKIAKGMASDCFMKRLLDRQEKDELDDEHIAYLGGILMEAGSDTTSSTLLSFLLAMAKYPQALKAAQAEVDAICADTRSPTSDDINNMPYVRACMNETLRWRPVAAGGIPHLLTEDDTYDGYFLPKGTMLFANAWSIHRDEEEYEQAEEFIPERFMSNKFGTRHGHEDSNDDHRRQTYGFGAGRRVCPGQRLAENSLMVNMSKVVWAFDIRPQSTAVDVDIETAYSDGFLTSPKQFSLAITPRSSKHREVIAREYKSAQTYLARYAD